MGFGNMMVPDYGLEELRKAIWWAVSGSGHLKSNYNIRKMNELLYKTFDITRNQTLRDFLSYYFDKGLHRRYDKTKCGLRTYVVNNVEWYLKDKIKRLISERRRFISWEKLAEEGKDPTNDLMKKGDDGIWRVKSEIVQAEDNIMPNRTPNPEKAVMINQVKESIEKFFSKYDPIFYEVYIGNIRQADAAAEQDMPKQTFNDKWKQIIEGLYRHLEKEGYDLTNV